jgi:hypothetical protein
MSVTVWKGPAGVSTHVQLGLLAHVLLEFVFQPDFTGVRVADALKRVADLELLQVR